MTETGQEQFILDTGMAIDDPLTVLLMLYSGRLDSISISSSGESVPEKGARNALRLATLSGRPEILIGVGRQEQMVRTADNHFPKAVAFMVGTMLFTPAPRIDSPDFPDAVEMMAQRINNSPTKIGIVVTGPATNIGYLLRTHPETAANISEVVLMSGAFKVPGNLSDFGNKKLNPGVEWNAFVDPVALELILQAPFAKTLVPLDATNKLILTEEMLKRFRENPKTSGSKFVANYVKRLSLLTKLARQKLPLWDPLTAMLALDSTVGNYEEMRVSIITDPKNPQFGRTLLNHQGHPVNVYVDVNPGKFADRFVEILNTD